MELSRCDKKKQVDIEFLTNSFNNYENNISVNADRIVISPNKNVKKATIYVDNKLYTTQNMPNRTNIIKFKKGLNITSITLGMSYTLNSKNTNEIQKPITIILYNDNKRMWKKTIKLTSKEDNLIIPITGY
jgi:hypothetical protein